MLLTSVDAVVETLCASPLLRSSQNQELQEKIAAQFSEAHELLKHLVRQEWITLFQAKKVLAGKIKELFVGSYILIEKIGEGGMGRVYKARQLRLNRLVALKIMRNDLLKHSITLKRFEREAQAAAQLSHPNIVRLYDANHEGDLHYLAMELVTGTDLSKMVRESGPLPIFLACSYIRQAALGLQHAHERNIVHRDIKPSNLLVSSDITPSDGSAARGGIVKILDMGLARIDLEEEQTDDKKSSTLTKDGTVVGTPDYMSPEQGKNSSIVDYRADLYSLGCTFFFLLTGRVVYPNGTTIEKLLQHQMDPPEDVRNIRADIPETLSLIIQRLLEKKPEDRFASALELAQLLEPWCRGLTPSVQSLPMKPKLVPNSAPVSTLETFFPNPRTEHSPFDFGDDTAITHSVTPASSKTILPTKKGKLYLGVIAGVVSLLILIVLWSSKSKPKETTNPIAKNEVKPAKARTLDALEKYLPDETALVVTLNNKELNKSSLFQKQIRPELDPHLAPIKEVLGYDPLKMIERVTIATEARRSENWVILLEGISFVTPKARSWFESQPNVESQVVERIDGFKDKIYHIQSEQKKSGSLYACVLNTNPGVMLFSPQRLRMEEAMNKAIGKSKTKFADPVIAKYLSRFEQEPKTLWMLISGQMQMEKENLYKETNIQSALGHVLLNETLHVEVFVEGIRWNALQKIVEKVNFQLKLLSLADARIGQLSYLVTKLTNFPEEPTNKSSHFRLRTQLSEEETIRFFEPFLKSLPNDRSAKTR